MSSIAPTLKTPISTGPKPIINDPPSYLRAINQFPPYPMQADKEDSVVTDINPWIIVDTHNQIRSQLKYTHNYQPQPYCWDQRLADIAAKHVDEIKNAECSKRTSLTWIGDEPDDQDNICKETSDSSSCAPSTLGSRCVDFTHINKFKAIIGSDFKIPSTSQKSGVDGLSQDLTWSNIIGNVWSAGGCSQRNDAYTSPSRRKQYDAIVNGANDRVGCHMERFKMNCKDYPTTDVALFVCAYDQSLDDGKTLCGKDDTTCTSNIKLPSSDRIDIASTMRPMPTNFDTKYTCAMSDPIIL